MPLATQTTRSPLRLSPRAAAPDDEALMRQVRGGDAEAMNELLRLYWGGVVEYAVRFVESRDQAEDIAQEVFLRVWQQALDWRGQGTLRSFLYGVARNHALNQGRRWREVRVASFDSRVVPLGAHPAPTPLELLDRKLEEAEVESHLRRAVAALPPRRQEIFTLARVHGLSYQEIAETLRLSPQTVANQMSRALADLRRTLRPLLEV